MIKLEEQFIGGGDVVGFIFTKVDETPEAYIYKVDDEGNIHYEVFEKKEVHLFDFQTQTQSEETKEAYPKGEAFGSWASTTRNLDRAYELLWEISNRVITRNNNRDETI